MRMHDRAPAVPFAWGWVAFDLGEARPCAGTYCHYPYEDLPPLPPLDGTLSWLGRPGWPEAPDVAPERRVAQERWSAEAHATVRDLATQAERLGVMLPTAFTRLMAAPELYTRIPEYAGCWFNLEEAQLDPCPGSQDACVVRFLNDQQDCTLWYLYLTRHGAEAVLAVGDPYPNAPSPYLERLVRPNEDAFQQRLTRLYHQAEVYPDFDHDPHPALEASVRADLRRLHVKYRDFTKSENPPILHRKETFVTEDYLGRNKFARLTAQDERLGLLADTVSIGTRERWEQLVACKGLQFAGHRLVRRKSPLQTVSDSSSSIESWQRKS
jgi:hypothetical protein